MEICEQCEMFVEEGNDYVFDHTKFILKEKKTGNYFYSETKSRLYPSVPFDINKLRPIPLRVPWPPFDRSLTRAPIPLPANHYIKRPSLLYYSDEQAQSLRDQIMCEAKICEILRNNPHPNIAEYLGCVEENGSIKGLCFVKYSKDLIQRVETGEPLDLDCYLQNIECGIRHLHALGLIHNDINPRNIMVNEDDRPVIIDFDSCKQEGEELCKSGTPGWAIENAQHARRENDFFSFFMIKEYLLENCS